MIIDGIFGQFAGLLKACVDTLPLASIGYVGWGAPVATMIRGIGGFSTVLPVQAALVCAAAMIVYQGMSMIYEIAMWIVRKVPIASIS